MSFDYGGGIWIAAKLRQWQSYIGQCVWIKHIEMWMCRNGCSLICSQHILEHFGMLLLLHISATKITNSYFISEWGSNVLDRRSRCQSRSIQISKHIYIKNVEKSVKKAFTKWIRSLYNNDNGALIQKISWWQTGDNLLPTVKPLI